MFDTALASIAESNDRRPWLRDISVRVWETQNAISRKPIEYLRVTQRPSIGVSAWYRSLQRNFRRYLSVNQTVGKLRRHNFSEEFRSYVETVGVGEYKNL